MQSEWKKVKIGDVCKIKGGKRLPKGKQLTTIPNNHPYIRIRDITNKTLELNNNFEYVDNETQKIISNYIVNTDDIIISIVGTIGLIAMIGNSLNGANLTENCVKLVDIQEHKIDRNYLYYFLKSDFGQAEISKSIVGAVQQKLPIKNIQNIEINIPDLETQKKIAKILSSIDDKIELNHRINENLQEQAQAIYNKMFIFTSNEQRKICRAEEYFDISIGKTPPRNEHQWFTTNSNDVPWISISDMGKNETYISRSSENLTKEAVEKFNIKIIPNNTVILSFKLTIGRVLITNGKMASNEAIAHFKTDKIFINEYLYFYLKNFRYQTMGNTSSIATAVNSKIIKSMPFVIPTDNEINNFHLIVKPMFKFIRNNTLKNEKLADLRDTLLPRLMSGEIDVSALKYKI